MYAKVDPKFKSVCGCMYVECRMAECRNNSVLLLVDFINTQMLIENKYHGYPVAGEDNIKVRTIINQKGFPSGVTMTGR